MDENECPLVEEEILRVGPVLAVGLPGATVTGPMLAVGLWGATVVGGCWTVGIIEGVVSTVQAFDKHVAVGAQQNGEGTVCGQR
jgi:hypothetical protein